MEKLNLPKYSPLISTMDKREYIFDIIRKKKILLTPEEWVRQHFINLLINYLGYPKSLIKIEGGLKYNSMPKRSDILIYSKEGSPLILVECKRSQVKLDQKVFDQAAVYNQSLKATFLVITNGLKHYCAQVDWDTKNYEMINEIPIYKNLKEEK